MDEEDGYKVGYRDGAEMFKASVLIMLEGERDGNFGFYELASMPPEWFPRLIKIIEEMEVKVPA